MQTDILLKRVYLISTAIDIHHYSAILNWFSLSLITVIGVFFFILFDIWDL